MPEEFNNQALDFFLSEEEFLIKQGASNNESDN